MDRSMAVKSWHAQKQPHRFCQNNNYFRGYTYVRISLRYNFSYIVFVDFKWILDFFDELSKFAEKHLTYDSPVEFL